MTILRVISSRQVYFIYFLKYKEDDAYELKVYMITIFAISQRIFRLSFWQERDDFNMHH